MTERTRAEPCTLTPASSCPAFILLFLVETRALENERFRTRVHLCLRGHRIVSGQRLSILRLCWVKRRHISTLGVVTCHSCFLFLPTFSSAKVSRQQSNFRKKRNLRSLLDRTLESIIYSCSISMDACQVTGAIPGSLGKHTKPGVHTVVQLHTPGLWMTIP